MTDAIPAEDKDAYARRRTACATGRVRSDRRGCSCRRWPDGLQRLRIGYLSD
ncbi:Uncharacterised protein [Mycobacteroides abscessus subsp. abscessus]|nr:Uncharacterised protein [Mycobacteroides abscessus subsp. abscessus]